MSERQTDGGYLGITLTGAGEDTPIEALVDLAAAGAELGLLYTFAPDGRRRYPRREWIAEAIAALAPCGAALHVCGGRARLQLLRGELDDLLAGVGRLQINGAVGAAALPAFRAAFVPGRPIITQHTPENAPLLELPAADHAILVDGSGGRGLLPERWERPRTWKPVGFAGGLGPETLRAELPKITAVARPAWWLDMEARLRDERDRFDVEKAWEVLRIYRDWSAGR